MVIEADMAGNYVGSSYGWATTRDWSKLDCCTCTKETGMGSRGELGEICATPPQRQRVLMGRSFG
jgi:hypothetical protein